MSIRNLISFLILTSSLLTTVHSYAQETETISLGDYIDLANRSGLNVIYSSDLLRQRYQVTHDISMTPSLASLKKALNAYGLDLNKIGMDTYTVIVADQQPIVEEPAPVAASFNRLSLEEVVVSSSRYRLYSDTATRTQQLDAKTLAERAVSGNDAVRIVNQLPGSATIGVSAKPRVRGGNEDETLILFDGVRLYSPFHFNRFNNLFSSFDNRLLSNIDFYSGGFPASIGDRLSAAMLITTKDNYELRETREVGVGLFNVSYLQALDLGDQSLVVSARRSNFELLDQLAQNDLGTPSFGDLFARYSRELDSGAQLDINLLWFGDDIEINNSSGTEQAESHYFNTYLWAKVSGNLTEQLTRSTIFGAAQILNDREGILNKPNQVRGTIEDDQTFRFYFASQNYEYVGDIGLFSFGWDYRYLDADYEYASDQVIAAPFAGLSNIIRQRLESSDIRETGHQGALYVNWKQHFWDDWSIEAGLRLDAQHYERSIQDEHLNYRLGFLYEPTSDLKFRLGWGQYSQAQGIHELNISDLENDFQPVQTAMHIVAGVEYQFGGWQMRIETYRKHAEDARVYYQNLANPYTLIPELQTDRFRIQPDGYLSRGVELSMERELLGGEWWFNYSHASVKDELPGQNIRRSWDQSRAANIGYHRTIKNWQVSVSAAFHEGWLTTPLSFNGTNVVAGARNSERFDHFYSVDFKTSRSWSFNRGELRLEMGITNVLNRENQIGVNYELESGKLTATQEVGLPLAPFLDLFWSF